MSGASPGECDVLAEEAGDCRPIVRQGDLGSGRSWVEDSAAARGLTWILVVFVACSVLVGEAVLRVAGGVFYGLGDPPAEDPQMARQASGETSETEQGKDRTPLTMIVPAAAWS